jgi:hypothetical protein
MFLEGGFVPSVQCFHSVEYARIHFKTEKIMILHEAKNVYEEEMLALTPLNVEASFPDAFPAPLFAFGDDDEEEDMEEDDFDDMEEEDFDDDEDDFEEDEDDEEDDDDDEEEEFDDDEDYDYDEDDDFEYEEE